MLANMFWIGIGQIQSAINPHLLKTQTETLTNSPDLIDRQQCHQSLLSQGIAKIDNSFSSRVFFCPMVSHFCQRLGWRNTYTDSNTRPIANNLSNLLTKQIVRE